MKENKKKLYKTRLEIQEIEIGYILTEPMRILPSLTLFDLNFHYIIKNRICENSKNNTLLAIILVTSYLGNVEVRSAMRRAFSPQILKELNIRRMFLLGLAPNDTYTSQNSIVNENERFKDILQGNFIEAYRNLTYKHVMGLKWASENCGHAKYIIKMDDDTVLNLYKILDNLKTTTLPTKKLLAGYVLRGMIPIREPANKWYVTKFEYGGSVYPTFLSGWFYITTPDTCRKLVEQSKIVPYFWIDDLYVTGLLAQRLQIKHYSIGNYFTPHTEFLQCCIRDMKKLSYDCEVLIGPNGGDNNLFLEFNEVMKKCSYQKCDKRTKSLNDTCVAERKYPLGRGSSFIQTYQLA